VAANTNPVFTLVPNVGTATLSAGNTNRDGTTGTYVTLFTAGADGSMLDRVTVTATGTTTAGLVRLFLNNGTTRRLYEEIAVTAVTPSGTTAAFTGASTKITPATPLTLATGWTLDGNTHNAESFHVLTEGGNF